MVSQVLEDADVDMPIMAVTELSANGESGSDVVFRKQEGMIVDVKSNATSRFVRRKGVYFMKMFVPTDVHSPHEPLFSRPGSA